ncbi:MAG TPA: hypothetical protein VFT73_05785 [Sphingomonas sp.]|nr:hypothetical protein [Sphingomonas sp.]
MIVAGSGAGGRAEGIGVALGEGLGATSGVAVGEGVGLEEGADVWHAAPVASTAIRTAPLPRMGVRI